MGTRFFQRGVLFMASTNEAIVRRWFNDIFGNGNMEALEDVVAEDIQIHNAGDVEVGGRESFRQWVLWYRSTFADSKWTFARLFEGDDKVVARYRSTSTYKGGFVNIPSSDQQITETGIIVFRIMDSKVSEIWCEYSGIQVLEQLGVFPPKV